MKANAEGALEPCPGYLAERLLTMPEFGRVEMPAASLYELLPLLDSSDMGPEDWARVAGLIDDIYHTYDAFVVIMGTDTMAYAASALSFMVRWGGK
jgi:L-asparaginase